MSAAGGSEIDGVWAMVRAEFDGVAAPELVVNNTSLELARGEYRVLFGGEISDAGTFEIDGGTVEKTMTLRGIEGPNAGRIIPCLYQLAGNRLRVCYGLDGVKPTELVFSAGKARYFALYRRKAGKSNVVQIQRS